MPEKDLVNLRKKEVVKLRLESLKFRNEYGLRAAIAHVNDKTNRRLFSVL